MQIFGFANLIAVRFSMQRMAEEERFEYGSHGLDGLMKGKVRSYLGISLERLFHRLTGCGGRLIRPIHITTLDGHFGNKHKKPKVKNYQKNNIQKEKVCPSGTGMRCGDNRGALSVCAVRKLWLK